MMKYDNKQNVSVMCILGFMLFITGCARSATAVTATAMQAPEATATALAPQTTNTPILLTQAAPIAASTSPTAVFVEMGTATPPLELSITPDAPQLEGWQEYQRELAKKLMYYLPVEEVLCEWDIMGQADRVVYVWAVCMGTTPVPIGQEKPVYSLISVPAIIHLGEGESVQSVESPDNEAYSNGNIRKMFPPVIQEKFDYYNFGRAKQMSDHIEWRIEHPEEPPLIVLSATPAP